MNAKIVEPQNLRRGFRQSFHILDYFFIPVDTMHNKPISDKRKGNGTPIINWICNILQEVLLIFITYNDHSKTTPNQTDIRNAPTPYLLPIYSFLLYKEKEAFGPANIRNR